jgi:hypothetical protein
MPSHLLAMIVIVGATACADQLTQEPVTTTSAGSALSNYSAALELAKTRCERATECNVLGTGHRYADETACVDAYQDVGNASLNSSTCPDGVDRGRLDHCFGALLTARCGTALDPVASTQGCNRSFCARVDPRSR